MPGPIRNRQQIQQFLLENADKTLEVVNVSANPEAATTAPATEVRADNWREFSDQFNSAEGDYLRVRSREPNGNVSNWITLQNTGSGAEDVVNAKVWADAVGMEVNESGSIDIIYLGDGFVSEPGAQLRFTNERTHETFDVTLDHDGNLPEDFKLQGQGGDEFSLAVSDGVNNVDFSEKVSLAPVEGEARIDLEEPAVWAKRHLNDDGEPTITTTQFTGPLFIDEPSIEDVKQGSLANCYFSSAIASIALTDPDKIKEMIKDNGDGTYDVTFKERSYWGVGGYQDKVVTVDGDLFVRSSGKPMYGSSNNTTESPDKMEMWHSIVEKAYATFKGNSYDKIGNGGNPGNVMSDVLGVSAQSMSANERNAEAIYSSIQRAQENGWPVTATTYGKDSAEAERYSGVRIYPWHVYSVMGVEEKDGEKFVQVRNPWGKTEPGYDGKDDGIFRLKLEDFVHYYKNINYAKG